MGFLFSGMLWCQIRFRESWNFTGAGVNYPNSVTSLCSTVILPEEVFCMAHVDHVVLPSHLLEVQGHELRLVVVDSLLQNRGIGSQWGSAFQCDETKAGSSSSGCHMEKLTIRQGSDGGFVLHELN